MPLQMKKNDVNMNPGKAWEYMLMGVVYVITLLFLMDYINSGKLLPLAIVGCMAGVISYAIFFLFKNGRQWIRIVIPITYVITLLVIRVLLFPL